MPLSTGGVIAIVCLIVGVDPRPVSKGVLLVGGYQVRWLLYVGFNRNYSGPSLFLKISLLSKVIKRISTKYTDCTKLRAMARAFEDL